MKVLTKDKCQECDGSGVLATGIWVEFYRLDEEYKKANGNYMEVEDVEKWFQEKGYRKMPPEEYPCSECEGVGEVQKWISVNELLEKANIIG